MALVAGAVVWGGLVFVISSFVGLPLAAAIFNSGDQALSARTEHPPPALEDEP